MKPLLLFVLCTPLHGGGEYRGPWGEVYGHIEAGNAEAPTAILRTPIGPSWFTANDTNDDGDLTWDEFIGPEASFRAMDTDKDGLVDANEATAYEAMLASKINRP